MTGDNHSCVCRAGSGTIVDEISRLWYNRKISGGKMLTASGRSPGVWVTVMLQVSVCAMHGQERLQEQLRIE